jgi:hypothetical protein
MAIHQIEINDTGELVGDAPAELSNIFKRIEAEHHKIGYGQGAQQAAADAKKQIADAIDLEKRRLEAMQPLEKERVSRLESEHQALQTALNDYRKDADRTLKAREEAHAREIVKHTDTLKLRDDRILELTRGAIRAEASAAGARDESLEELSVVLDHYIGYDEHMMPFVKAADGSPQMSQGKPVAISAFVRQYLDTHQHHRRPAPGRGGDARRGLSTVPGGGATSVEAAKARIDAGDRSPGAINDLLVATMEERRRRAS